MAKTLRMVLVVAGIGLTTAAGLQARTSKAQAVGIHKIQHVIIVMQENRSFDSYFGTYPGADGIPTQNGVPTICVPDPRTNTCVKPFHDTQDLNQGGPHAAPADVADVDGGKLDGFIAQQEQGSGRKCPTFDPTCAAPVTTNLPDVMGYHTGADIPNYWTYASDFVLQDHMFQSDASWSLPAHLYLVSGWSAKCKNA